MQNLAMAAFLAVLGATPTAPTVPVTFTCSFVEGTFRGIGSDFNKKGERIPKSWDPLEPATDRMDFVIKWTPGQMVATSAGNNDIVEVTAIDSVHNVSFIEFMPGGGVGTLTVVKVPTPQTKYLAVYSRHAVLLGPVIASQRYGSCMKR